MEKAYDCVSWSFLYAAMEKVGIPPNLKEWINKQYKDLEIRLITRKGLKASIPVKQGLQQGDTMSPILFNFAANIFLTAANNILHGITHPS